MMPPPPARRLLRNEASWRQRGGCWQRSLLSLDMASSKVGEDGQRWQMMNDNG